jgi:hypothetical protein
LTHALVTREGLEVYFIESRMWFGLVTLGTEREEFVECRVLAGIGEVERDVTGINNYDECVMLMLNCVSPLEHTLLSTSS